MLILERKKCDWVADSARANILSEEEMLPQAEQSSSTANTLLTGSWREALTLKSFGLKAVGSSVNCSG